MKRVIKAIVLLIMLVPFIAFQNKPVTIFMVGDSTMSDKPVEGNPERGWGMVLPSYFNDKVLVENHAMNGRSSRTFIEEGRWAFLLNRLHAGDVVVIEFGHNDEGQQKKAYTTPDDLKKNLERMVKEVRAKDATPILCTPIARRKFDTLTHKRVDTHPAIYPETFRTVAAELKVPLVDMQRKSEAVLSSYGVERSADLFLHFGPGVWKMAPNGRNDDTHLSEAGAMAMAACFVSGVKELNISPLKQNLLTQDKPKLKLTTPVPGIDKVKPVTEP